ncbi:3,4-dihydroxy-2-butanone 4-phosphate synthase [Neobacillus niacini]|uniref:3,4-dihydroxy-2-butanone-4-phosphate synthase n=1 Tax=Neobacillus niacini TaxID=86668 RepID=UPI00285DB544|nr:3,4-dihydroxy-2-butanone-4-phosphate synthase [Neobacillus niacini]MDR7075939.1 3,4-dihydroxy-2-butanone 4-phosphate synthase [Neobacillus niacini]
MSVLSSVKLPIDQLKDGGLIIIYDDIKTHMGIIIGLGEYVNAEKVNLMTKIGRGLVYACITEERAKQLQIPKMEENNIEETKPFAVSIDYKDTTTGISSFERSDTIKALTNEEVKPDDFKRPGHVFPLISKEKGLMERVDLTEAVVDLSKLVSNIHVGYMVEILNEIGDVASKAEVEEVSVAGGLPIIQMSDLLKMTKDHEYCSFRGMVINGRKLGRSIGFPTANIHPQEQIGCLLKGVYGVKVIVNDQEYVGVMNVGSRLTFNEDEESIHYEVHILDFDQDLYWKNIEVKVCFYLREEISFSSISDLVTQIKKDIELVKKRFNLLVLK